MIHGHESIDESGAGDEQDEQELEALLDFLHRDRGFDFTGHKRPSLLRRIRRRMSAVGLSSLAAYRDHLALNEDELGHLFDVLLINVTAFFRDPPAWQALAKRLPSIVDPDSSTPIRVWSAGCSSGEEPYTLAMVLSETLGEEAFSRRVKIYATDIDEAALAHARVATYSSRALEMVPPELVEKYFVRAGDNFVFKQELRRDVIFGRHDLLQDAPIPRVDVLTCRNALMYFDAQTQERILQRLQFSLVPSGVLFLGKAEMLLSHAKLFVPVDLKMRLFAPMTKPVRRRQKSAPDADDRETPSAEEVARAVLRQLAFEGSPVAQIVVDTTGRLAVANQQASTLCSLSPLDVGKPFQELGISARWTELAANVERVRLERSATCIKEVERVLASGEKTFFDIVISPLLSEAGSLVGVHVALVDVTPMRRMQVELRRANLELEASQEELRAARAEVRSTHQTLQATNEELETTNEELQSTNEELEAVNEELQSTNEELQTINEELRQRGTELNETTALFGAVLASFHAGVAVLDRELRVQAWNSRMVDLFGVRAHDLVGKSIASLAIGLPVRDIATSLRVALDMDEESERTIDCTSAHGKSIVCRICVSPLRGEHTRGVIVLVEEVG